MDLQSSPDAPAAVDPATPGPLNPWVREHFGFPKDDHSPHASAADQKMPASMIAPRWRNTPVAGALVAIVIVGVGGLAHAASTPAADAHNADRITRPAPGGPGGDPARARREH